MIWTVGWYEAFVATMQARSPTPISWARTVELGLAMGAADGVAVFAGQAAVLATIAGHHAELPPVVAEAIGAGPVQLTFYLAHAIVSVASGPREVASELLGAAAAAGFRNVPPDLMWMTSMLGYAILAIELEDLAPPPSSSRSSSHIPARSPPTWARSPPTRDGSRPCSAGMTWRTST